MGLLVNKICGFYPQRLVNFGGFCQEASSTIQLSVEVEEQGFDQFTTLQKGNQRQALGRYLIWLKIKGKKIQRINIFGLSLVFCYLLVQTLFNHNERHPNSHFELGADLVVARTVDELPEQISCSLSLLT